MRGLLAALMLIGTTAGAPAGTAGDTPGIHIGVAGWVPRPDSYGKWGVTRAGEAPGTLFKETNSADRIDLPQGSYDVYWVQDYDHQTAPLLLARDVEVAAGRVSEVAADAGIRLQIASWVPPRDDGYGSWGVARAGQAPKTLLHSTRAADALLLPPGAYDLYWIQDYDHLAQPLLLAGAVKVVAGQLTSVAADTGIRLATADWVPKRDASYGRWGAARAGQPPGESAVWSRTRDAMLLPPGAYDIYWVQDYDHQEKPLMVLGGVRVEAGRLTELAVSTGIELKLPADTPPLDGSYGWWGVVAAGDQPGNRISWSIGHAEQPLLVPPGRYDVVWKQDYQSSPVVKRPGVLVKQGELLGVDMAIVADAGGAVAPMAEPGRQPGQGDGGTFVLNEMMGSKPQMRPGGFPMPSLQGFERVGTVPMGNSGGYDTVAEQFVAANGDQIIRISIGKTLWAVGWAPGGNMQQGYALRDPQCSGKLTERWPATAALTPPECAMR